MLSRKTFLKNSALIAGGMLGPDLLMAQNPSLTGVLRLSELRQLHRELYLFGDERVYEEISQRFFQPEMELGEFVRAYLSELRQKYPLAVRGLNKPVMEVSEFRQFCGLMDGATYLYHKMVLLYQQLDMEHRTIESAGPGRPEQKQRILAQLKSLLQDIEELEQLRNVENKPLLLKSSESENASAKISLTHEGKIESLSHQLQNPVTIAKTIKSFEKYPNFPYTSGIDNFIYEQTRTISWERARWKSNYMEYTILEAAAASRKGQEIKPGHKKFLARALNGNLFQSLILERLKFISRIAQSGIINENERIQFQIEASGLSRTLDRITTETLFDGRPLYGAADKRTVTLPNGRRIALTWIDSKELKLVPKKYSRTVFTPENAQRLEREIIGPALHKMRRARIPLRGAMQS